MSRLVVILPILGLLLALAPAAPVPRVSKPTESYFPTKVGTKRVYWVELSKKEVVELVEDAEVKDGEIIVTIRRSPETSALPKQEKLSVSAKGIVRLEESSEPFRPPVWLLKLPHEPGAKWDNLHGHNKSLYTVGEIEEVEVPAGKFKAIPVTRHWSMLNTPVQTTDWYAPGVGLVKRVLRGGDREVTQLVLKSVTTAEEMEKAVMKLCAVFTDKKQPESAREDAIRKLLSIGLAARYAIPDLIALLDDPNTSNRLQRAAVAVLTSLGPRASPAVPTLVKLLERSATQWELLQAVSGLTRVGLQVFRLDGQVVPVPVSRFAPRGRVIIGPHLLLGEVTWRVEADQGLVLRAIRAAGPTATPTIEALKRYRERVQGHFTLEKQARDALVAIGK